MEVKQFVDAVNRLRLANRGKWYWFNDTVSSKAVRIKAYGRNYVKFFSQDGVLLAPPHHSEVSHRGLKFLLEFEEFSCGFGHYLKWYGQWAGE